MASGFKRSRGNGDEYVFVDGRAMRADEVVRIQVDDPVVPGQAEATAVPGAAEARAQGPIEEKRPRKFGRERKALKEMNEEDALELREDAVENFVSMASAESLMHDDKRKLRRICLIFLVALIVVGAFSLCVSSSHNFKLYSPSEVLGAIGTWFHLTFLQITDYSTYVVERANVLSNDLSYTDILGGFARLFKYVTCGALLGTAGMLYQNTFRNPIAAPSMLGVGNGTSMALLIMVLVFGTSAINYAELYYVFAYVGGALVLALVLLGGRCLSGKNQFNVVNMILVGTIVSQLLGVIMTYVQNNFVSDAEWTVYYQLQAEGSTNELFMYITIIFGIVACFVPIVLYRFRLNLVSFSDEEVKLLGVSPLGLRILALVCGSLMVLTAQVNAGQVAMASLVVPFVVRAVFGSEFSKQLVGNVLVGSLLLLVCGTLSSTIIIWGLSVDVGTIVTILVMPLFVWMLAVRQRSWE